MSKTTFFQKIGLLLLSAVLSFAFLEAGLRLGGFVWTSLQEYRNQVAIQRKGTYRIMCLGESTTAMQYPPYLEEILNERSTGVRFSVIDKGFVGTKTDTIVALLESNLDQYHPDMVITMMGINDDGIHIPYKSGSGTGFTRFWRTCRTYKLFKLLEAHLKNKLFGKGQGPRVDAQLSLKAPEPDNIDALSKDCRDPRRAREIENLCQAMMANDPRDTKALILQGSCFREQGKFERAEAAYAKAIELDPDNKTAYLELGTAHRKQSRFEEAEKTYRKAVEIDPRDDNTFLQLANSYKKSGKTLEAIEALKKAVELNPQNDKAYFELGDFYRKKGDFRETEKAYQKAIELNPSNANAYFELGYIYRELRNFTDAEAAYKKAIELEPHNDVFYYELGDGYGDVAKYPESEAACRKAVELNPRNYDAYRELGDALKNQGKYVEAEKAYKKAIELNPRDYKVYPKLGKFYQQQGQSSEAVKLFQRLIEEDPKNDKAYGALGAAYREMGREDLAREYSAKAVALRERFYDPKTVENYHKLKRILAQRGVRYVCVQYPMRDLRSLKKIFGNDTEGIIFVDNEKIFKDAVRQEGYAAYFGDMFAGDFGHCTEKGNRLLARNIADIVLKEVFDQ